MTDEPTTAPRAEYRAQAEASSPSPQDWGRALQIVLQDLARQAERDGHGTEADALLGADLRLSVEGTPDGVRVTAVWPAGAGEQPA